MPVWEQIGAIALIFVIVIPGIFAAVRWLLNDQRKAQLSSQQALLQQQQEFIDKHDQQWQTFWEAQHAGDRTAMERITAILQQLVDRFGDHDTWERTKLSDMQQAINDSKTKPRKL